MKPEFTSVRIPADTFARYQTYAAQYQGISASAMVEMVLTQVADMIDQEPAKRMVPRFVQVMDIVKADSVPLLEKRPAVKLAPARN